MRHDARAARHASSTGRYGAFAGLIRSLHRKYRMVRKDRPLAGQDIQNSAKLCRRRWLSAFHTTRVSQVGPAARPLRLRSTRAYSSDTRASASKTDTPAKATRAVRPLTKGSGNGRSSSGPARIAAPAPITAAGHDRTGQAAAAPTRSESAETMHAPNKMARPVLERSDAARCSGGK
jgi:hypothetical protein